MNVQVGKPAPEFEAEAYRRGSLEAARLSLKDYRGRWVVLFFYMRDFTLICQTEICAYADLEGQFQKEAAEIVAASTDSFSSHKAWFESNPRLGMVNYPVLADTSHQASEAYGVLLPAGTAQRATFIIDPEGAVRYVDVTELNVGRNARETLRVLQALKTGEPCPAGWRPGQPTLSAEALAIEELQRERVRVVSAEGQSGH